MVCRSAALLAVLVVLTTAQQKPPVWPPSFSVDFVEIVRMGLVTVSKNNGSWHYDFPNRRARFDHNRGQRNNFCQDQQLSDADKMAPCHLIFAPDAMYVHYPTANTCCSLCKAAIGCSVLRPDWLSQGHFLDREEIGGRECSGWAKHGVVAAADTWFVDADGVPCRYHEVVSGILHNLTFVPESYSPGSQDSSLFEVPSYCNRTCPHPYKPPSWLS